MKNDTDNPEHSSPPRDADRPTGTRRYFERPDPGEAPLSLRETVLIVISTHLGVRPRSEREKDFRRANGLHIFIAGVIYFALLVALLIGLASYLAAS